MGIYTTDVYTTDVYTTDVSSASDFNRPADLPASSLNSFHFCFLFVIFFPFGAPILGLPISPHRHHLKGSETKDRA
jgi:hypothetical protein